MAVRVTRGLQFQAVHVYCDGSIDGSKYGCGLFVRNYTFPAEYTKTEVSKRFPDYLSFTRAELYAVFEGLYIIIFGKKNFDSQGTLYALYYLHQMTVI